MIQWLRCIINKGMFSDERTVTVSTRSGENIAVFVSKDDADEQNNRVKVEALTDGSQPVVALPDDHRSVVDVNAEDLQPA